MRLSASRARPASRSRSCVSIPIRSDLRCSRDPHPELVEGWVIERFFAWLNRNRRLAKDVEATIPSAVAFLYAASLMTPARACGRALAAAFLRAGGAGAPPRRAVVR